MSDRGPQSDGERAASIYTERYQSIACRTDRMFAALLLLQLVACLAGALLLSPLTWIGSTSEPHVHVFAAGVLGALFAALPVFLVLTRPGEASTRYVIAAAQMLFSALLIHVTGGRIETHFHVFGSLAFLAFYRDWKVFVPATLVVTADHFIRGVVWPESIYGIAGASSWRWVEHAAWVLFEVAFLAVSCLRSGDEMQSLADQQALLERSQEKRYRDLYEHAPAAYLTVSPAGIVTSSNRRAGELLGGQEVVLPGQKLEDLLEPCESLVEQASLLSQILIVPGGSEEMVHILETRFRTPDSGELWVRMNIVRDTEPGGKVRESRVLLEDVTDRKRATEALSETAAKLREASWRAGMAEVASNVLHNVGNVLNSVNTSIGVLVEQTEQSRVADLGRASELLRDHQADLPEFVATKRGRALPEFVSQLSATLLAEKERTRAELGHLEESVGHVREIIGAQQANAIGAGVGEPVALDALVKDAVRLAGTRSGLEPVTDFAAPVPVELDRCKVTQILVNLIRNGMDALDEVPFEKRKLTIRTRMAEGISRVEVEDSGCGIAPEDLVKIFGHGYTTKASGNGFGLHSAAIAAQDFGGSLVARSEGVGRGTCFTLTLPALEECAA